MYFGLFLLLILKMLEFCGRLLWFIPWICFGVCRCLYVQRLLRREPRYKLLVDKDPDLALYNEVDALAERANTLRTLVDVVRNLDETEHQLLQGAPSVVKDGLQAVDRDPDAPEWGHCRKLLWTMLRIEPHLPRKTKKEVQTLSRDIRRLYWVMACRI